MTLQRSGLYEFGPFRLDLADNSLQRDGQPVKLEPKAFEILCVLVENANRLVKTKDLILKVWGYAEGVGLGYQISKLRDALNDKATEPQFIATVSGKGFRFIAKVREVTDHNPPITESGLENKGSITVLPFVNRGLGSSGLDVGSVMADLVNTALVKLERFDTMPESRNPDGTLLEQTVAVSEKLMLEFVVSGSVIQSGRQVIVVMHLTTSRDKKPVWSRIFTEKDPDTLQALDAISQRATDELREAVSQDQDTNQRKRQTKNNSALNFYELGWSYLNQRTPDALMEGLKCFERAVKEDPNFALAYAGVADCNLLLSIFGSEVKAPRKAMPKAKTAVLKALEIDHTIGEAHASLASVKVLYDRDWSGADVEFQQALLLNPEYATAHQWYAHNLALMGKSEEALAEIEKARQLSPRSPIINATISRIHFLARNYEDAIATAQEAIKINQTFFLSYVFLAIVYKQLGRLNESIEQFRIANTLNPKNPATLGELGHAFAISGKSKEARKLLRELQTMSQRHYIGPMNFAKIYMGLGDMAKTFKYLEESFQHRSAWLLTLKVDPIFDGLRSSTRFQDLLKRTGF